MGVDAAREWCDGVFAVSLPRSVLECHARANQRSEKVLGRITDTAVAQVVLLSKV